MMELGLITPEDEKQGKMLHNDSHKFESSFLGVTVPMNRSVMFGSLSGSKLGIWVAHGEGKFSLPYPEDHYNVVLKYSYDEYPGNPNGSDYSVAGIASQDGRHLAMMPHLERACFPWNNAYYPAERNHPPGGVSGGGGGKNIFYIGGGGGVCIKPNHTWMEAF